MDLGVGLTFEWWVLDCLVVCLFVMFYVCSSYFSWVDI